MDCSIQGNLSLILDEFTLPEKCNKPLRLGVIGCGKMFQNCHGEAIKILQSFGWPISIGSVTDIDGKALKHAHEKFPDAIAHCNYRGICDIKSYDAFIVQLWDPHSEEAALWLLNNGIPFLIEKPVSLSIDILQKINTLSIENEIPVAVGYNRRFQCGAEAFRNIYKSMQGSLHLTCRFLRACRSEKLFYEDIMGHSLDFIQSVIGNYQIDSVSYSDDLLMTGIKSHIIVNASFNRGTVQFEFRPSCGQNLESYEIIGHEKSAKLVYHPIEEIAESPQMIYYTPTEMRDFIPKEVSTKHCHNKMMVLQGFLHQMANALKYISGERVNNICTLEDAYQALAKIQNIK